MPLLTTYSYWRSGSDPAPFDRVSRTLLSRIRIPETLYYLSSEV